MYMVGMNEEKLISGILDHDREVLSEIYSECFPMVDKMVQNSGGNTDYAKDIFQEGMLLIYRQINSGKLKLCCRFSTYLYAVCKKIWSQEKRKSDYKCLRTNSLPDKVEEPEVFSDYRLTAEELFFKHFNQLSQDCRKILRMHFNKCTITQIQKSMGYDSPHYVMDRKYRCKKSLIKRIMNDPKFKSAKNEYKEQVYPIF